MQDNSILDLVASFEAQSNKVKNCLTNLLDVVKSGCVPSKEDMSNLNDYVSDLHIRYDMIYDAAKSTLSTDELPLNGVAVKAIAEAVNNSHSKFICNLLDRARGILEKFISIKSLIDGYALALAPYQSAASDILNQLEEKNVEELLPQTKAPELFLQAMEAENIHSLSGIDLMTKVQESFPDMAITVGLVTKQYYFDDDVPVSQIEEISQNEPVPSNESVQNETTPENDNHHEEESSEASTLDTPKDASCKDDESNGHSTDSQSHSTTTDEGLIDSDELLSSINDVKISSPSVKAFKNDLNTKYPPIARVFLPLLTNLGALTANQAYEFAYLMDCIPHDEESRNIIEQCASKLSANRGILSSFSIRGGSEVAYCLTPYSNGCLRKSGFKARESFKLSLGQYALEAEKTIKCDVLENAISMNDTLLCYLTHAKEALSEEQFRLVKSSIHYENGAYHVSAFCAGEEFSSFLYDDASTTSSCENLIVLNPNYDSSKLPPHSRLIIFKDGAFSITGTVVSSTIDDTSDELPTDDIGALQNDAGYTPHLDESNSKTESEVNEENPCGGEIKPQVETNIPHSDYALQQGETATGYANQLLSAEAVSAPQLFEEVVLLLGEKRYAEALVLLETIKEEPKSPEKFSNLYSALTMTADFPVVKTGTLNNTNATLLKLQSSISEESGVKDLQMAMLCAATLRVMLFPSTAYDYDLYNTGSYYVDGNFEKAFPKEAPIIRNIVDLFTRELKNISFKFDGLGFSPMVIDNLANDNRRISKIHSIQEKARELEPSLKSTMPIPGFETGLNIMVGPASTIGKILHDITANNLDGVKNIENFIRDSFCDADNASYVVQQDKVEKYIDASWAETRKEVKKTVKHLEENSAARNICDKAIKDRLLVIVDWLTIVSLAESNTFAQIKVAFTSIRNRLVKWINELIDITEQHRGRAPYERAGKAVLNECARSIRNQLNGNNYSDAIGFYDSFIRTPYCFIDHSGTPTVIHELYYIKATEPWRVILESIITDKDSPSTIINQIDDFQSSNWYRDFGRESLLNSSVVRENADENETARNAAQKALDEYYSKVRLARAYGKIQESLMVTSFGVIERVKQFCFDVADYALFDLFLGRMDTFLNTAIRETASSQKNRIDTLKQNPKYVGAPIFENIDQALMEEDFVRVDTYLNRLEGGESELTEIEAAEDTDNNFLQMFLQSEDAYYNVCTKLKNSGEEVHKWAILDLRKMDSKFTHWSNRNEQGKAESWVNNWIRRKDSSETSKYVGNFIKMLGFNVAQVKPKTSIRTSAACEVYPVSVVKTPSGLKDYRHPIYKYGTDLPDMINVVCLFGCKGVSTLISVMTNDLQLNGPTIVLMDGSLSAADRRKVSLKFKSDTSCQSPFLLIDRVLLLFLASLDEGDRLCAMLRCTLPFTYETLYGNGTGFVPDEMFIGRAVELRELTSMTGPCLVYGGRQLGKTALLNRARKILHHPEDREYAFCCLNVKDNRSDVLLNEVNDHLKHAGLIDTAYKSVPDLCFGLSELFEARKYSRLTIFVDEVDELFNEYKENDYKDIRPFVNLMDKTGGHARFVFAGTHNVAATEAVMKNNNNLLHLGQPLCIEPLSIDDASKLIRRPMSFLGFDIGKRQLELIINNTNCYPGLIHMFCGSLVRSVCENFNDYYSDSDKNMLPYRISDEQMKAVFQKQDIRKEIGKRVMATIELNKRYNVVASLLAYMIYERKEKAEVYLYGFSASEISEYNANDLKVSMILNLSVTDLEALLDEMVRIGILWKNNETKQFRFKQTDYLEYIGDSEKVLDILCEA